MVTQTRQPEQVGRGVGAERTLAEHEEGGGGSDFDERIAGKGVAERRHRNRELHRFAQLLQPLFGFDAFG